MSDEDDDAEDAPSQHPSAIDPVRIRRIRDRGKREAFERQQFWQLVFGSEVGRREMWAMLNRLGTFDNDFKASPGGFPDERATWFRAGQKAAGLDFYMTRQVDCWGGLREMHAECDPRFAKASS